MPTYSDNTLSQLIINKLTKSQYEQITPVADQFYIIDDGQSALAGAFYAEYGVDSFSDVWNAYSDGKAVYCVDGDDIYSLVSISPMDENYTAVFAKSTGPNTYAYCTLDYAWSAIETEGGSYVADVTVNGTSVVDADGIAVFNQTTAITSLATSTVAIPSSISVTASGTAITALSTTSFTPKTGVTVTSSITAITALNSASITPVTGNTVLNSATYSSGVLTLGTGNAVTTDPAIYFALPSPKTTASALQTITLTDGTAITYVSAVSSTATFLKTVTLSTSNITLVSGASSTKSFVYKP